MKAVTSSIESLIEVGVMEEITEQRREFLMRFANGRRCVSDVARECGGTLKTFQETLMRYGLAYSAFQLRWVPWMNKPARESERITDIAELTKQGRLALGLADVDEPPPTATELEYVKAVQRGLPLERIFRALPEFVAKD